MQGKQPNSSEQFIRLFYSELFNQTEGSVKCHRASSLLLAACIARADKMVRTGVSLAEDGAQVWERLAESAKLLNDPTVRSLWTEYELRHIRNGECCYTIRVVVNDATHLSRPPKAVQDNRSAGTRGSVPLG